VIVRVTERSVEMRVPLAGVLRGVDFNKDDGTLPTSSGDPSDHCRMIEGVWTPSR